MAAKNDRALQTALLVEMKPEPQGDRVRDMWDIVDRFRRQVLLKPPHQRDRVWDKDKNRAWVQRIQGGRQPIGAIVTYQVVNHGTISPVFINDGYQRISATVEYLDTPEAFGSTPTQAEMYVRSCEMPVQHRHYTSHDDALVDFQQINMGTQLTPYEFHKGTLSYMPRWSQYEASIDRLHTIIPMREGRIVDDGGRKREREVLHKHLRNDYGLLLRFLDVELKTIDYPVGSDDLKPKNAPSAVESKMRRVLESRTPEQIAAAVEKLERLVDRETALLEDLWYGRLGKGKDEGVAIGLYRYIMDAAIAKRHRNVPQGVWESFVLKFLMCSFGRSSVNGPEGEHINLSYGKFSHLYAICRLINSDLDQHIFGVGGRRGNRTKRRPGYDDSHLLPFSQNGNGQTFGEPAGRNRARGAQPV